MVKPNQTERRRHPRVRIEAPVELGRSEGGLACQLKDISRNGAAVILAESLGEMEMLGIEARIAYPDLPLVELEGVAVVIRCTPREDGRYDVGLWFQELTESSRDQLDIFLAAVTDVTAEC